MGILTKHGRMQKSKDENYRCVGWCRYTSTLINEIFQAIMSETERSLTQKTALNRDGHFADSSIKSMMDNL